VRAAATPLQLVVDRHQCTACHTPALDAPSRSACRPSVCNCCRRLAGTEPHAGRVEAPTLAAESLPHGRHGQDCASPAPHPWSILAAPQGSCGSTARAAGQPARECHWLTATSAPRQPAACCMADCVHSIACQTVPVRATTAWAGMGQSNSGACPYMSLALRNVAKTRSRPHPAQQSKTSIDTVDDSSACCNSK
jgi:hypothetical protein